MTQGLYSAPVYPLGHFELAKCLINEGKLRLAEGDASRALPALKRSIAMIQDLSSAFLGTLSEAEALNFMASFSEVRDTLITAYRGNRNTKKTPYSSIWQGRAAVTRLVQLRQQAMIQGADPESRAALGRELLATRHELARRLLASTAPGKDTAGQIEAVTARKERLERQLADRLPGFRTPPGRSKVPPRTWSGPLPRGTAFVDFVLSTRSGNTGRASTRD